MEEIITLLFTKINIIFIDTQISSSSELICENKCIICGAKIDIAMTYINNATYTTVSIMDKNEWLNFLWALHNKVRNAKGIKLSGISALNEINNYLLFFFMERHVDRYNLPEHCKFSYLYDKFASKQAFAHDKKTPEIEKKNMYLLWNTVYNANNEDSVIKCLMKNDFFNKYLNCMIHRPSAYALSSKAMASIQECFALMYEKLKDIEWTPEKHDMFGSAFEQFKEDAADKRIMGQHFTPPSIKNFIVSELNPKSTDRFYDPCAGSGGFIHTATSYVMEKEGIDKANIFKRHVYANECDSELTKSLMINMLLHDVPVKNIQEQDSLDYDQNCKLYLHKFDKVGTNPPFGMKITHEYNGNVDHFVKYWKPLTVSKKIIKESTAQFILHILNSLKEDNGHAGIVIDRGFLNNGCDNANSWETKFRQYVLENYNLYKVVLLPTGIFTYTNFATAIIFIKTGEETKQVELYVGKFADPNNKKSELVTNDEPDLVVKIDEIEKNSWSLKYELDKQKDDAVDDAQDGDLWVPLGDLIEINKGKSITAKDYISGKYNLLGGGVSLMTETHNVYNIEENTITMSNDGSYAGHINKFAQKIFITSHCNSIVPKNDKLSNEYLYYYLKIIQHTIYDFQKGQAQPSIDSLQLKKYKIPLLPIDHQQEIVKFLDKTFVEHEIKIDDFVKAIGRTNVFKLLINKQYDEFEELVFLVKQNIVYDKLLKDIEKEKKIKFKQELDKVETEGRRLGDLVEFCKKEWKLKASNAKDSGAYKFYTSSQENIKYYDKYEFADKCLIIGRGGVPSVHFDKQFAISHDDVFVLKCCDGINGDYLHNFLLYNKNLLDNTFEGNGLKHTSGDRLKKIIIDIPLSENQQKIVQEIEKVNKKQQQFQQHAETIEEALKYALETVKDMCIVQNEPQKIDDTKSIHSDTHTDNDSEKGTIVSKKISKNKEHEKMSSKNSSSCCDDDETKVVTKKKHYVKKVASLDDEPDKKQTKKSVENSDTAESTKKKKKYDEKKTTEKCADVASHVSEQNNMEFDDPVNKIDDYDKKEKITVSMKKKVKSSKKLDKNAGSPTVPLTQEALKKLDEENKSKGDKIPRKKDSTK